MKHKLFCFADQYTHVPTSNSCTTTNRNTSTSSSYSHMSTSSLCSNTSSKMCTFVWRSWGWQVILITFRCCLTFTFSFCCRWSVLLSLLLLFSLLSATWFVTTGATFLLDKVFSYITLSSAKLSNRVLSSDILSGVLLLVLVHVNSGGGAGGAGSGCN